MKGVFNILNNNNDNNDNNEVERSRLKKNKKIIKSNNKNNKNSKNNKQNKHNIKWVTKVSVASFVTTAVLAVLSNEILGNMSVIAAGIILILFIFIGVVFDVIGLAIATADEKPFHSMSSHKVQSAKYAIKLIRNAEKVSSICNDVISDIAGIISGSTGTAIAASLFMNPGSNFIVNILITGLIAALTVGGKAYGKSIALNNNSSIVNIVSKIIYFFSKNFGNLNKKQNKNE